VAFEVVDLAGRRVARLGDGAYPAGRHAVPWDGRSGAGALAPGIYLVRMQVDGHPAGQHKYTVLP
jgi:flagellar hook capping protein FlgD